MKKVDLELKNDTSKILLFSDIHFHEYKPFSSPTADGVGSRLKWLLLAFDSIINYALKNGIEHLFFLGDLFHQRTLMYSIVFDKVTEAIDNATAKGIKFHFILGNHDYIYNSDDSPSIITKLRNIDVIDQPTIYSLNGFAERIACTPFRFTLDKLKEDLEIMQNEIQALKLPDVDHILLGHFELSGAQVNDEYVLKNSIDPTIFEMTLFKYIFSGHVHKAQTLPLYRTTIEFLGHTLPHTFNDENNSYGFIVYDFAAAQNKYKFIPLNSEREFPEFVTIDLYKQEDIKDFITNKIRRFELDYFRIRSYSDELKLDNVFKRLSSYTAEYMGPVIDYAADQENEDSVQFNLDIKYYLRLFIEQKPETEWLDQQKLFTYLENVFTKGNICLR